MSVASVRFTVADDEVIGDLHLPVGDGPWPAVIVGGPMTSVKEQVTGVYSAAIAARGIAALALDHRHYGASGGQPRQYEHQGRKIADLKAALQWLAQDSRISRHRLGAVGVCLGAGYAVWAAVDEPLVRAIGAVAGYYRDPTEMRARDAAGFDAKVVQGVAARLDYQASGVVAMIPAAACEGDAAMQTADTVDYYTRRAAVPSYVNRFAVMSREHFLPFDVQAAALRLAAPILMIHARNALSPSWAQRFHDTVAAPKKLEWLPSRGQTDFYDDQGLVAAVADRLAAHLHRHL